MPLKHYEEKQLNVSEEKSRVREFSAMLRHPRWSKHQTLILIMLQLSKQRLLEASNEPTSIKTQRYAVKSQQWSQERGYK
jgi:hypothetical protein